MDGCSFYKDVDTHSVLRMHKYTLCPHGPQVPVESWSDSSLMKMLLWESSQDAAENLPVLRSLLWLCVCVSKNWFYYTTTGFVKHSVVNTEV